MAVTKLGSLKYLDYEQLSKDFGRFGKFQWFVFSLALYSSFVAGVIVVSSVFTSKTTKYRCKIASCDTPNTTYNEDFLNFTTPWDDHLGKWNQCSYYALTGENNASCSSEAFNQSNPLQCQEWVYDRTLFRRTTVTDFTLSCKRSWLVSLETSAYMLGMLIGSLVIGWISDSLGRRVGQLVSVGLLLGGCVIGSFSVSHEMFLVLKIFAGMGGMGCFQIAFVVSIEYVGPKDRSMCGIIVNVTFALGEAFMGLVAYFIRDWRYMQLAAAAPSVLIISYYWLMPESVRWLIAMKREDEARNSLKKAFRMNKVPTPKYLLAEMDTEDDKSEPGDFSEKTSIMALMKSKIILRRTFILFYLWTVCTLVYFGLSLFSSSLSGNVFLNFTAIVLIEVPSYVASSFFIERMGRKGWHLLVYNLAGIACICVPLIPSDQPLLIMILSLTGKFGASAAFASIFLFTGELYPTPYRALGIGACSMLARIGSILAPFVNSLSSYYAPLPALIFGVLCIIAGFLTFALPETLNIDLPQTIAECEQLGRHQKSWQLECCMQRKGARKLSITTPSSLVT